MYQVQKGKSGLAKFRTIQSVSTSFSHTQCLAWFDMVLAALDCYNWVFSQNLLSPDQVFIGTYESIRVKGHCRAAILRFSPLLQWYILVFNENLYLTSLFLVSENTGTSVFVVLNHFIKDISQADLCAVSKLFEVKLDETIFSPKEIDDFNR